MTVREWPVPAMFFFHCTYTLYNVQLYNVEHRLSAKPAELHIRPDIFHRNYSYSGWSFSVNTWAKLRSRYDQGLFSSPIYMWIQTKIYRLESESCTKNIMFSPSPIFQFVLLYQCTILSWYPLVFTKNPVTSCDNLTTGCIFNWPSPENVSRLAPPKNA